MKRVIVTGATGFIGRALTAHLLQSGYHVYAVVRDVSKMTDLQHEALEVFKAELPDYIRLPDKITDRQFDAFYHLAWDGTFGESFKDYHQQLDNAAYAADALAAAANMQCERFVLAGTIVALEAKHHMLTDDEAPRISCNYGTAKAAAEMLCKTLAFNMGIALNVAVIANAYGVGDYSDMIQNMLIRSLLQGKSPPLVSGEKLYDWIYIDDVAAGLEAIGRYGKANRSYYVGHRKLRTFRSLVTQTRDILAPSIELKFGALADKTAVDYSLIDRDALFRDTGFLCRTDFEESIRRTAQWLCAQNLLGPGEQAG